MNNLRKYRTFIRRPIVILSVVVLALYGIIAYAPMAYAESGIISLKTDNNVLKKGEVFTVVCRVSAQTGISEADFYVDYNTSVLEFVDGGAKASKEVGGVHIQSLGNSDSPIRRTFSLQFISKREGDATVFIRSGAIVIDGEGDPISLRTDKIELSVTETGEIDDTDTDVDGKAADGAAPDTILPEATTKLSGNNRVSSISTNATQFVPEFDTEIEAYDAEVSSDTETFFIDYKLDNKYATAKLKGNRDLNYGMNKVKLIVTAQNGKKRTYLFMVTRLSEKPDDTTVSQPVSAGAINPTLPLDKESTNSYSILLYIVIGILAIFSISMIVLVIRQKREIEHLENEMEAYIETKDDRGGGEGDYEGGEVRREDGKFRYRN